MRKKDHLANGGRIGQKHDQPVDADSLAGRRRHTVLQGLNIIPVHEMRLIVSGIPVSHLLGKTGKLVFRIIEF